jgi:hypothetical protein
LQQTNLDIEAKLAHEKIGHMSKCCNILGHIDFDQFSKNLVILGQFDSHLKHVLLKENSLKELSSKIQCLSDLLTSSSASAASSPPSDLSSEMNELTEKLTSQTSSLESLSESIDQLKSDFQQLTTTPAPSPTSASDSDNLLDDISKKLDQLCKNEPVISNGINELKQSIESMQSAPPPLPPPLLPPPHAPLPDLQRPAESEHQPHGLSPISELLNEFISDTEAEQLHEFLSTCNFKPEKSHSVVSFGTPYDYNGAKSATDVPSIPDALKPLLGKINDLQTKIFKNKYPEHSKINDPPSAPIINSCLINKYDGQESYLPQHSDKEVTIHPESSIFTLSLGQPCRIKFTEIGNGADSSHECADRSLYHMTRRSQEVFSHSIEKGSISEVRYSLTFRSVDWRHRNSTCLVGDSNTGHLRFGTCKRSTFGELMPGQRFWAPKIKDIDPKICMGYSNVVLMCGINDIKNMEVQSDKCVAETYCLLKSKIKQIRRLSPKSNVFVCQLLPTKNGNLNEKVNSFNRLIYTDLLRTCSGVQVVDGFQKFADHRGLLADGISKKFNWQGRPDLLHLNKFGVRILASLIKHSIFIRLHGGIDKRRHSGRNDGRLYSDAARNGPINPPAPRR